MIDPFVPIELTADGAENIYRITHDCQSCLCSTCEVSCYKFMECQEEFVGYHTRFCKKYARLPVVSSDDSK